MQVTAPTVLILPASTCLSVEGGPTALSLTNLGIWITVHKPSFPYLDLFFLLGKRWVRKGKLLFSETTLWVGSDSDRRRVKSSKMSY